MALFRPKNCLMVCASIEAITVMASNLSPCKCADLQLGKNNQRSWEPCNVLIFKEECSLVTLKKIGISNRCDLVRNDNSCPPSMNMIQRIEQLGLDVWLFMRPLINKSSR